MITQLIGRLVEKSPTEVVIDCNGVGYLVHISLHTYSQLSSDENIKLFTHLQVKEDSHTLFGFFTTIERAVFQQLISVSGIGASTARTMLSSLEPQQIQAFSNNTIKEEALSALEVLGYSRKQSEKVIDNVIQSSPDSTVETLIKAALNKL